jgi:hypothetical protein
MDTTWQIIDSKIYKPKDNEKDQSGSFTKQDSHVGLLNFD